MTIFFIIVNIFLTYLIWEEAQKRGGFHPLDIVFIAANLICASVGIWRVYNGV